VYAAAVSYVRAVTNVPISVVVYTPVNAYDSVGFEERIGSYVPSAVNVAATGGLKDVAIVWS